MSTSKSAPTEPEHTTTTTTTEYADASSEAQLAEIHELGYMVVRMFRLRYKSQLRTERNLFRRLSHPSFTDLLLFRNSDVRAKRYAYARVRLELTQDLFISVAEKFPRLVGESISKTCARFHGENWLNYQTEAHQKQQRQQGRQGRRQHRQAPSIH